MSSLIKATDRIIGQSQWPLSSIYILYQQQFLSNRFQRLISSMLNNYMKNDKERAGKRSTFKVMARKKRASSQNKTFQMVYSSIIHRKDNEFCTLESPNLNQQIEDLKPFFNDTCKTALSTPPTRTPIALTRKKYINIKQKIQAAMEESSLNGFSSLKQLFNEKQSILTDFLNDFTNQLEKECKQKGDILKYIWNTMVNMIESISESVSTNMKLKEKCELENNLKSHQEYQGLLDGFQKKQIMLNEKSKAERVAINSLVFELRFKRKEINKLYRNQKLLVNKLNEYKSDNLNLQSSYIDLMCSLRDVPPEKVELLLKAREQIDKCKQKKYKINRNRKNTKNEIKAELSNEKIEELENLYDEIKQIANNQVNSPHLISTLIEASIENFGLKNDDLLINEERVVTVPNKALKKDAETQINEYDIRDKTKSNCTTQFGYLERLTSELINHRDTQTYCQYPKKKLLINVATEIEINALISQKFTITKSVQQSFLFQIKSQTFLGLNRNSIQKHHRKNLSDASLSRKSYQKLAGLGGIQDFIQEKDDQSSSNESIEEIESKISSKRKISKLRKSSGKVINFFGNLAKDRHSSMASNSSIKISASFSNLQTDQTIKKSNFAPTAASTAIEQVPVKNAKKSEKKLSYVKQLPKSRESVKIGPSPKFKSTREQISRNNFLQKNNYFNIEIDAHKQEEINNMFSNNQYAQMEISDDDAKNDPDLDEEENIERLKSAELNFLNEQKQQEDRANCRKTSGLSVAKSIKSKQHSQSVKYEDENQLLLNLCRLNYHKTHKKLKERIALFKYHDEFTCVRDKIEFVARDVKNLIVHKQAILKKTINNKNLKNTYKILMMTFSKAYDAYNKGILKGNLIYPLFESFALVYGAINNNQIYKKMINFIAALAVNRQNAILRFFLFFLGLDHMSPYSEKVTISEVYLCLKLLEKISVDGKVTLNIESIYTDTTKIKQQLNSILNEQKIPEALSQAIESRVTKQLQNSCLYKNSTTENTHLKLNIYNIVLLIIQEVIKCKNSLKETFIPILSRYEEYQTSKKLPVYIIEVILSDWKTTNFDPVKLKSLIEILTKNGKRDTVTIEQFCSILFQCNLVSIDQLYQRSEFVYKRNWKIPQQFVEQLNSKLHRDVFASELERREIEMFFKISSHAGHGDQVEEPAIQKMKRIIFEKHYERKIEELTIAMLGPILGEFAGRSENLALK